MAPRALWKAQLRVQDLSVPVRLYTAVRDQHVHFHLLHAKDHARVHERMINPTTEQVLESDDTRWGYTLDDGEVAVLTGAERKSLAPKPNRDITIERCVPWDALPLAAYGRPYWLGPDGDQAGYAALVASLAASKQLAIAQWVMRGKHHFGALSTREGRLMLNDLRSADEWLDLSALELPEGRALDKRELAMAEQLLMALDGPFDHAAFHDEYRERVQALIDAKARGAKPARRRASQAKPATTGLTSALAASLRGLKRGSASASKERKSA
jgi:DNA end-binding protein Ku